MIAPPAEPPSTVRALLVAGLITAVAAAARAPLLEATLITEAGLAPWLDAWLLLGHPGPAASSALGFGAALSHLPLLLHDADGLRSALTARAWLQALVPAVVWFAARQRGASVAAATAAALLLVAADGLLRELLLLRPPAVEWVALAVLGASFRGSRLAAVGAGFAVGMATMNAGWALAAAALVGELQHRRAFGAALGLTLLPALLDARAAVQRGASAFELLGLPPGAQTDDLIGQLTSSLAEPTTLVLIAAPLAVAHRRPTLRAPALALGLSAVLCLACGWVDPGWWCPLAPWLAAALAPALNGHRLAQVGTLGIALFAGVSDGGGRSADASLGRAGHALRISEVVGELAADGPGSLLAVAEPGGGSVADLRPVLLDRALRGTLDPLLGAGQQTPPPARALIHVEGGAAFVLHAGSSLPAGVERVSGTPTTLLVTAPDLATARPWLDGLCALREEPLHVGSASAWAPRSASRSDYACPDSIR